MVDKELPKIHVSFQPKRKVSDRVYITNSVDTADILKENWDMSTIALYEEFKVIYLDRRNGVIGIRELSKGSVCGTVVDIRLLLCIAVSCNSSGIIISHNHPSGKVNPSKADNQLTKKIEKACEVMEVKLLDHVIIAPDRYYSYADEGMLS